MLRPSNLVPPRTLRPHTILYGYFYGQRVALAKSVRLILQRAQISAVIDVECLATEHNGGNGFDSGALGFGQP